MELKRNSLSQRLLIICIFFLILHFCFAIETINSPTQLIRDSDSITSLNQIFTLGFFSPSNSSNRYIGIWYTKFPGEIVWVANRENPLNDSSGVLRISGDGNLVVLDRKQNVVWTTNVSITTNSSQAELLNSGNLVVRKGNSDGSNTGKILWQSFDYPTNTLLQDMKISSNTNTGEKHVLTSWKSDSDPSVGSFRVELETLSIPQVVVWNGSQRHWRSGPWNGIVFIGVEGMSSEYLEGFNLVRDEQGGIVYVFFSYSTFPFLARYVLNPIGKLKELGFNHDNESIQTSEWPQNECEYYGKCGTFAFCNNLASPLCSCLRGYNPKSNEEWRVDNWSGGCIRRMPLLCDRNNTNGKNGKGDGFLKYERMKVPDFANRGRGGDLEDCIQQCLMNCSCTAYSYVNGLGCLLWHGSLIDINKFSSGGVDLYTRVAHSELDKKRPRKLVIILTVLGGLVIVGLCLYISLSWMEKQKGMRRVEVIWLGKRKDIPEVSYRGRLEETETPLFRYETLEVATDNFSETNKLGEGGFGSVYKGKLLSGEEIAVKRLSRSSGQGIEEFKNEVAVISRLQHRNLVRLLGFCIEGEEKMLIYEFMPNKSLDVFLFDPTKKALLTWGKCFEIIEGIARGVLYLHKDSRLKVIHRDLKPSNILLDEDLNPKISDFGMAKIFGGKEIQANTTRVVGTYGYMSPEYAMEGIVSEKSDVYSFGVLLLEIITGMRNTGFYHDKESISLIRYVWKLWNEDRAQTLVDRSISEPSSVEEILRCIHVGLLCVQDYAMDRPSMLSVLTMLTSNITSIPTPNQPAFTGSQGISNSDSLYGSYKNYSANEMSITTMRGR
ncbi:non-specific serine/threonine protein kinase [Ranunculus cassubicifolius]